LPTFILLRRMYAAARASRSPASPVQFGERRHEMSIPSIPVAIRLGYHGLSPATG
jgi:hypothetical protein